MPIAEYRSHVYPYPLVPALPWVAGFFYDCTVSMVGNPTGTINPSTHLHASPIFIPNAVTATSIVVEITIAGTAGALCRLGLYDNRIGNAYPGDLIVDGGTVLIDATGARSVTISQALVPGWHWLAQVADTGATYRAIVGTAAQWISNATRTVAISNTGVLTIQVPNATTYASDGLPGKFPNSDPTLLTGSIPRILIGV